MVVLLIGVTAAACGDDSGGVAASRTTVSRSTSTTTVSLSTTATIRSAVPLAVEVISAGPSAGSGEISVRWNAVVNATGYRVLRANTSSGPFSVNADIDITTGKTTAGTDVTNIWSQQYSYKPTHSAFAGPDSSPRFEYIEIVSGGIVRRYFAVVAYNTNGEAPASVVVCGAPTSHPAC